MAALPVALLAAACAADGDEDGGGASGAVAVEVRPFEEVQAGPFVFEADPNDPTRGIFRVTTTEPMICAIVWGEGEDLGRFNNSLAMNGTGIVDHDVLLPDLEFGREYTFIVQGTTADGTLYRSERATFSIDAPQGAGAGEVEPPGPQLVDGVSVLDVSSEFSAGFAAELAIDGDLSTEWSTAGDGDDGFIELDLGADVPLSGVEFLTRSMADGSAVTTTFTVRLDGGEPLGPFPASTRAAPSIAELDVTGRIVRLDVETSTGGNVGAVEVRVYGTAP